MRLSLVLARRFGRAPWLVASSLIVALAAVMVAVWYCILQAQSLTGEQIADRDLGRFGAYAGFGAGQLRPGSAAALALERRVAPVLGRDSQVALVATDFWASSLSDRSVTLTEMAWETQPFQAKNQLLAGRWPQQPGEVAIVNPARGDRSRVPSQIEAYGGRVRLTVVGTVDDRFAEQVALLAAPGTWAGLSPGLAAGNPILQAYPVVYWDGSQPDRALTAITDGFRQLRGPTVSAADLETQVRDSYAHRTTVSAREGRSWINRRRDTRSRRCCSR